jgi:hypothetical protein
MPPVPPLAQAKRRARAAYECARRGDAKTAALYDHLWSETLLALDGKPADMRAEMLRRTAILFEILVDRRGWLAGKMR